MGTAHTLHDQLYSLQRQAKKIVYSHETALFLHGITDRTPFQYAITVPSNYKPSAKIKACCVVRYCRQELYPIGQMMLPTGMGHEVCVYDLERTICDILRTRNKIDVQILTDSMKRYAVHPAKNLNRLGDYAERFRVEKVLRQYLEVLL